MKDPISSMIEAHLDDDAHAILLEDTLLHGAELEHQFLLDLYCSLTRVLDVNYREIRDKEPTLIRELASIKAVANTKAEWLQFLRGLQSVHVADFDHKPYPVDQTLFSEYLMDACKGRYDLTFDTARFTYWDVTNQVRSATREPTMRIHDPATRITIDVAEVGDKIEYPWIRVLYFFNGGNDVNGFIKIRNTFRAFFDLLVGYSDKLRGVESMVLEAAMNPITGVSTTDDLSRPWRFEKHKSGLNKLQRMWSLTGGVMPFYPEDRRMFWCLPEVLHEMLSHPECPDHLMKNFHPKQSFYSDEELGVIGHN